MNAFDDIRLAEARRMLGLESGRDLRARAEAWLGEGVDVPSVRLLADAEPRTDSEALRILRSAAVELDLTFPTLQAARAHHVRASLPELVTPEGMGAIAGLSNGFTDEMTTRIRHALARLFRRGPAND